MRIWRRFVDRLNGRKAQQEEDLDQELRSHLDLEAEEQQEAGMSSEESKYAARRAFGNTTLVMEDVREVWGRTWLERLIQDSRFGLRQLRKSTGFTAVAILTLALGIGANTAIFTLVHAVMMTSLPVPNPGQLYSLGDTKLCCDTTDIADLHDNFALYSFPLYVHLRDNTPEIFDLAAFQSWLTNLSVHRSGFPGVAQPYFGEFVSGNYFALFEVGAFAGRTFTPADDRPNAQPVAVLSYRAWSERFGSDPSVIGGNFSINGQSMTVVGVMPPGFFGDTLRGDPADFWIPLAMEPNLDRDDSFLNQSSEFWLYVAGRVQPGTQPAQVQAKVKTEIQQWLTDQKGNSEHDRKLIRTLGVSLSPAGGGVTRLATTYGDGLHMLTVVSALVLLIACANIANLLLVRATASRSQTAVRVALGASRGRLMRQMVTEGILLALLGGVAGIAVSFVGTRAILLLAFHGAKYVPIDATPSFSVLGFALLISLLTGMIFSVAPAWIASNTHPAETMRGAGRATRDNSAFPQKLLVVLQAALSLVLLVGAGLMTQSLRNLQKQQFGFDSQSRLIVRLNPALAGYTFERLPALYRRLQDRFSHLPGVLSASLALHSPMDGWNWGDQVWIQGRQPALNTHDDHVIYDFVSAHYFETIGTRLLRGRTIEERDTPSSRRIAVVNDALARKFFPNENPIGKYLGFNGVSHSGDYEIVGVVENTKYLDPKIPADPMVFLPLLQTVVYQETTQNAYQAWANYIDGVQLHVAGRPENLQAEVRNALAEIDPNLTVIKMTNLEEQVDSRLNSQRLIAQLTSLYGVLALVLACVGLYGVAAYTVARRTSEIGLRMAIGAGSTQVLGMVLRSAMAPITAGLAVGIPVVIAAGHAVASQLYGVKSYDPLILGLAIAVLLISAAMAALVPARRAASIDPIRALRTE
jgi:macrolide transport system ATP-binding/permease protein